MRGKDCKKGGSPEKSGITPACAGKRECPTEGAPAAGDHPRVCGEKPARPDTAYNDWGSPPRVRGKEKWDVPVEDAGRITPACAGKSPHDGLPWVDFEDHPRVCGEKRGWLDEQNRRIGSPPRVRGKVTRPTRFKGIDGITPACAGKRTRTFCGAGFFGDHPRVCGEKLLCSRATRAQAGSPPRVRGKAVAQLFSEQFQRITPACAGKSAAASSSAMPRGDHPRVCGEKMLVNLPESSSKGSPPRVRGKGRWTVSRQHEPGITPACAGKRRQSPCISFQEWDHPRVCGEKQRQSQFNSGSMGSPPRVRGKVFDPCPIDCTSRITPACAGKSI